MLKNRYLYILLVVFAVFSSCKTENKKNGTISEIDYSDSSYWYSLGGEGKPADIFYIYPTVTMVSYEDNGSSWNADITNNETRLLANENQLFNKLLYDECNFYAPYYRQMIFETYNQSPNILADALVVAYTDAKAAFDYYMEHCNAGRPFFLVGHSQGSQVIVELLKKGLSNEQCDLMLAAYCIGTAVTQAELDAYPQLDPVRDSVTGKLVVFNSVTDINAVSPMFAGDAAGINPLIWSADTVFAPAELHLGMARFNDNADSVILLPHTVCGHLVNHVMVCPEIDPNICYMEAFANFFPYGNLHFTDSWLYAGNIKQNMRCRVRFYTNKCEEK